MTITCSAVVSTPAESTSYVYDKLGRMTEEIQPQVATPSGNVNPATTTLYDAVGNALAVTNALGYTTRYQYDVENRQIAEIDAATPCTEPRRQRGRGAADHVVCLRPRRQPALDHRSRLGNTTR